MNRKPNRQRPNQKLKAKLRKVKNQPKRWKHSNPYYGQVLAFKMRKINEARKQEQTTETTNAS